MIKSLTNFAVISIIASAITICLKFLAYYLTGSVGFLSDAFESIVNVSAAIVAYFMLKIAEKPADLDHMYGHTKAEYFSSIFEGILILVAAISIGYAAYERLLHPQALQQINIGLFISILASLVNLVTAYILIKAGKKHHSIALTADAHHLLTDVWTSAGVIIAVFLVNITNIQILDPIVAILVATNIIYTGFRLIRQSILGFMDTAIPKEEYEKIKTILNFYCKKPIVFHDLLTRQSASKKFVSVHILVPNNWSVKKGHDFVDNIEINLKKEVENLVFLTHVEPVHDEKSWDDTTMMTKGKMRK